MAFEALAFDVRTSRTARGAEIILSPVATAIALSEASD
jgi:hypothetical protein